MKSMKNNVCYKFARKLIMKQMLSHDLCQEWQSHAMQR